MTKPLSRMPVVLAALAACAPLAANEPETGVCERQLAADVARRFGQTITRIEWSLDPARDAIMGYTSQALVYTDACPGYHVYEIFGIDYDCVARAHYGEVRNYVRYRNSGGGC